ncbi:hypothetical protein V2J09_008987 [Rumex salicifolius]
MWLISTANTELIMMAVDANNIGGKDQDHRFLRLDHSTKEIVAIGQREGGLYKLNIGGRSIPFLNLTQSSPSSPSHPSLPLVSPTPYDEMVYPSPINFPPSPPFQHATAASPPMVEASSDQAKSSSPSVVPSIPPPVHETVLSLHT